MAAHTLNILTPSVNNLSARILLRAAGLDFEEKDVWGKTTEPEYLEKYHDHIARIGMTPESFAQAYSVPVRIRFTRVDGH